MKLKISNFIYQDVGYKEENDIKTGSNIIEGIVLSKPITAHITLMRLEEGISVKIEKLKTGVDTDCVKCLKKFPTEIKIPYAERIYYMDAPVSYDSEADQPDIFMVDLKQNEIDLTEMMRQEILLHFPTYRVCSKSCKGLCPKCGIDLNKKKCKCKNEKIDPEGTHQPFKNLKNLIKL
ncbi:MAG: DUF177 domain-containing protein [Candidatus Gracilibacteria bacterium]|jgi:uncharacterized protein